MLKSIEQLNEIILLNNTKSLFFISSERPNKVFF